MTAIAVAAAVAGLLVVAGVAFGLGGFGRTRHRAPSVGARMALMGVEVASVYRGDLSVTDAATGTSVVVARGPYQRNLGSAIQDPGFSPDGRFVAYMESAGSSSELHVVALGGGRTITVSHALSYTWSPTDDDLAVSLASEVKLISAEGTSLHRWVIADPLAELFSPSGKRIAVASSGLRSGRGYLRLLPVGTGPERLIRQPGCDEPAGWTADGSHLLFWRDEDCSASIGADGLPLDSIATGGFGTSSTGGGRSRIVSVAGTLPYSRWVVPVSGDTVLVNSGGDRVAADHKTLQWCSAATGAGKSLPSPAGTATLDPAVATRDRLFEVRVSQSNAMNDFLPHGTLWMSTTTGRHAHELTSAGTGVADPIPTADGSKLLFVRTPSTGSAKVEVLTIHTGVVRAIAAIDLADYYGEFMAPEVLAVWQPSK